MTTATSVPDEVDARFMAHALAIGRRGMGTTWPNPAVGCVIVAAGRVVGRGWTQPGGRPHAEVVALEMAGALARKATAYVTLEPCAHHGRTPPCTEALIASGIARVVMPLSDPDPRVSGRGVAQLREAGIVVDAGPFEADARRDHAGFLLRQTRGRPFLTLKLAMSLDGRIATAGGESQWITGPDARRLVHALRARHDAVMVGGGTARADDPMLTVRGMAHARQPVRIVISRRLDLPLVGQLARSARDIPLWIVHASQVARERAEAWDRVGATCMAVAEAGDGIDAVALMAALAQAGLTRVFCEGGGHLAASLLSAGMVDELHAFTAGLVLGADGLPGVAGLGLQRLAEAARLDLLSARQVGQDSHTVWARDPLA